MHLRGRPCGGGRGGGERRAGTAHTRSAAQHRRSFLRAASVRSARQAPPRGRAGAADGRRGRHAASTVRSPAAPRARAPPRGGRLACLAPARARACTYGVLRFEVSLASTSTPPRRAMATTHESVPTSIPMTLICACTGARRARNPSGACSPRTRRRARAGRARGACGPCARAAVGARPAAARHAPHAPPASGRRGAKLRLGPGALARACAPCRAGVAGRERTQLQSARAGPRPPCPPHPPWRAVPRLRQLGGARIYARHTTPDTLTPRLDSMALLFKSTEAKPYAAGKRSTALIRQSRGVRAARVRASTRAGRVEHVRFSRTWPSAPALHHAGVSRRARSAECPTWAGRQDGNAAGSGRRGGVRRRGTSSHASWLVGRARHRRRCARPCVASKTASMSRARAGLRNLQPFGRVCVFRSTSTARFKPFRVFTSKTLFRDSARRTCGRRRRRGGKGRLVGQPREWREPLVWLSWG